jgi:hypothetical protein
MPIEGRAKGHMAIRSGGGLLACWGLCLPGSPCLCATGRLWSWSELAGERSAEGSGRGGGGCPGDGMYSANRPVRSGDFPGSVRGRQVGIPGGDDAESAEVLVRGSRGGGGVCGGRGLQQCADCGGAGLLFSEQAGGAAGAPAECGSWPARSAGGRSAWGAFASACGFASAAAKELTAAQGVPGAGAMGETRRGKAEEEGGLLTEVGIVGEAFGTAGCHEWAAEAVRSGRT